MMALQGPAVHGTLLQHGIEALARVSGLPVARSFPWREPRFGMGSKDRELKAQRSAQDPLRNVERRSGR